MPESLDPQLLLTGGLLLIAAEMVVPGFVLLSFGLAAILVAGLTWMVSPALLTQTILFGACVVPLFASARLIDRALHRRRRQDDTLNDPLHAMIGRQTILKEPIVAGRGKAFFGDTLWSVRGHDYPAGTPVVVEDVTAEQELVVRLVRPGFGRE